MSDERSFRDIFDDLDDAEGTEVLEELRSLRKTIHTVNRNFEELDEIDQWFASQGMEIQKKKHKGELEDFNREYLRRIHNYIVSVYTLIKQTQRLNGKYGSESFKDTYNEGKKKFGIVERWKFLEQLRHLMQKSRLPPLDIKVVEEADGVRYGILVSRDEMMEKGSFQGWGRDYLESREPQIDLQVEVRRYHQNVNDFYDWYYESLQNDREELLSEREELIKEAEQKRSDLFDGLR